MCGTGCSRVWRGGYRVGEVVCPELNAAPGPMRGEIDADRRRRRCGRAGVRAGEGGGGGNGGKDQGETVADLWEGTAEGQEAGGNGAAGEVEGVSVGVGVTLEAGWISSA